MKNDPYDLQTKRRAAVFWVVAAALLGMGTLAACGEADVFGRRTNAQALAEWALGVGYEVGHVVSHQGLRYRCLQAHTSQAGWEPSQVPALWSVLGEVGSAEPHPIADGRYCLDGVCCPEGSTIVELTEGDDTLFSATAGTCIVARAGHDTVHQFDPTSTQGIALLGGWGNDTLVSGAGPDLLIGGPGDDLLFAHGGGDAISGGEGSDVIFAGDGDNRVHPGPGSDTVSMGAGNDTLFIFDLCEVAPGETITDTGGSNIVVTPVPRAELEAAGATFIGEFEFVVTPGIECQSSCTSVDCAPPPPSPGEPPVPPPIGPAPALTGLESLDAFLAWFYRIRQAEIAEAKAAIEAAGDNPVLIDATLSRLESARAEGLLGEGLMLVSLLGAMASPSVEARLIALLNEPFPAVPDDEPGDEWSPFDDEVAFRRQAMITLASRDTAEGWAAIRVVALTHPIEELRGEAIRTLAYERPVEFRAALRAELQEGDEYHLDRPNRSDENFEQRVEEFVNAYGTEP